MLSLINNKLLYWRQFQLTEHAQFNKPLYWRHFQSYKYYELARLPHFYKKKSMTVAAAVQSISFSQPNSYLPSVFIHLSCRKRYSQARANNQKNTHLFQHKREREGIQVRVNVHHMYMWKPDPELLAYWIQIIAVISHMYSPFQLLSYDLENL